MTAAVRAFDAAALTFQAFWSVPVLRKDLGVLVRCGHVERRARAAGRGTSAGWFSEASKTYAGPNPINRLGRVACAMVAAKLAGGRPS